MMRDVAICGTGYSAIGRALDTTVGALTLDACKAALNEAGLTPKDVDGMATYPAAGDSVPCFYVVESLGIPRLDWFEDLFGWMPAVTSDCNLSVAAFTSASMTVCGATSWSRATSAMLLPERRSCTSVARST